MAAVCEFDKLFTKTVPHIFENIFLSLDCKSFLNCLEVSKSWNDLLTTESFLRMGKSIFCEDIQKDLQKAAWEGNTDVARKIISSGIVDVNSMTGTRETPLTLAAENGLKDMVQLLLDKGAEPNKPDQDGDTPLHTAAYLGYKDMVLLLLNRGADPNMADRGGHSPLHVAAREGYKDVVLLLLNRGADPNMEDRGGDSPLYGAATEGHKDVVLLLLDKGADPNMADHGVSPLHGAAKKVHKDVVLLLLDSFISQMLYFDFRHRQTYKLTDMLTDDAHYGTVNCAPLHI